MADTKLSALSQISAPALTDKLYTVDGGPTSYHVTGARFLGQLHHICQGRLTTETGVPISTSDRTSQGTIYFTPYNGNNVALYDGTRWSLYTFTEISLALSALTSGKPYDVFLYDNAGTLTLELLVWTDDTTRATALTTQDGVYVKTGATTRRYLGTIYTTSTTATEDSRAKRYVWNHYNQVNRSVFVSEGTSHTINNTAEREWNGGTADRAYFVLGLAQEFESQLWVYISTNSAGPSVIVQARLDTTNNDTASIQYAPTSSGLVVVTPQIVCQWRAAAGAHFLCVRESEGFSITATMAACSTTATIRG